MNKTFLTLINFQKTTARGFTLIELLVVIAIIGILASLVLSQLTTVRDKSLNVKTISEVSEISSAINFHYIDTGEVPFVDDGGTRVGRFFWQYEISDSIYRDIGINGWNGPYYGSSLSIDAWGNNYIYLIDRTFGAEVLYMQSFGPNGVTDLCTDGSDDVCEVLNYSIF